MTTQSAWRMSVSCGEGDGAILFIEIGPDEVEIYRRYPFHARERIIRFSTQTLAYEKNLISGGGA